MKCSTEALLFVLTVVLLSLPAQCKSPTISGFVTDNKSRPLGGARVTIIGDKAKADTTTDSEGEFVVELAQGVEEGHAVQIRFEKVGYRTYQKWVSVSKIPLRVSLEAIANNSIRHASQPAIKKTESFSTLVPFHGEWKNSPIPMNLNLSDSHQEYYDSLLDLANRPDNQPQGWADYKDRKFESVDAQFTFVTRLIQFDVFRTVYFLERGVVAGIRWTAGGGVTPINRPPIEPPDATVYPTAELLKILSHNEFVKPADEMLWKGKSLSVPLGTRLSFQEHSNPEKGQVLTCTVRLEKSGYFLLDFDVQPGPAMNNQLPAGFSTQAIQGTTTYSVSIAMSYVIQRRRDHGFEPEQYAAWADSIFSGLKARMGFEPSPATSQEFWDSVAPGVVKTDACGTTNSTISNNIYRNGAVPEQLSSLCRSQFSNNLLLGSDSKKLTISGQDNTITP